MVHSTNNLPVNGTQDKSTNNGKQDLDNDLKKMLGSVSKAADWPKLIPEPYNQSLPDSNPVDVGATVDAFPPYSEEHPHVEHFGS